MSMSLLDLISQNQPHFQTHQALLVIGLQNDFILPDGKLPVDTRAGFLDRLQAVIPKFRQLSANVIWVQTIYEGDRSQTDPASGAVDAVVVDGFDGGESSTDDDDELPKDLIPPSTSRSSRHKQRALDLLKKVSARRRTVPRTASPSEELEGEDEELFLLRASRSGPACLPETTGVEFIDQVKPKIERADTVVRTTNYSAFQGTSLLLILRAKLVTELYICGCITNISVYATVMDAARHGIKIHVVEDCLGFRKQGRHDEALKRMVEIFEASVVTSQEILSRDEAVDVANTKPSPRKGMQEAGENLEDLVDNLRLSDYSAAGEARAHTSSYQPSPSPTITINGRQRTLSDASIAESRTTTDTKLSDEQFAEKLSQGARVPTEQNAGPVAKQSLVKSKIRMRPRSDKSKKEDDRDTKDPRPRSESGSHQFAATDTLEKAAGRSSKSGTAVDAAPRVPSIARAESSDKLRSLPPSREQKLKASASQPTLSSNSSTVRKQLSTSRLRVSLTRSSKSDTSKPASPGSQSSSSTAKTSPRTSTSQIAESSSPTMAPQSKKLQSLATFQTLGPNDHIAEGDSRIIHDFFPPGYTHSADTSKPLKDLIFHQLYNEVRWQNMAHQGGEVPRLVCCQGDFGADGSMPVYRHPTDNAPPLLHFSPKVEIIRKRAEKLVGHPLNHVLIQLYRSSQDFISEHSDKTLDIARGSSIVNVSFGAQRTMRLRTKRDAKVHAPTEEAAQRETQRVALPHNSMFILGLESNKKWLHGIQPDKRLPAERSEEERAYSGIRISLTFRHIATYLDAENSTIWGQGATAKDQRDAQDVINADDDETEKMVRAFSKENHESDFDWDEYYGEGFDVLHMNDAQEDLPILFTSNNIVESKMVQVFLEENNIKHEVYEVPSLEKQYELDRQVCYRDNDINHTEVVIAVPILLYLDHYHPMDRDDRGRICSSRSYETFVMISVLLKYWVNRHVPTYYKDFVNTLESLEERYKFGPGEFIAGRRFSIGDCSTWPALDELITNWDGWSEERFPHLTKYYKMLWKKKKSIAKLRRELPDIQKKASETTAANAAG